MSFRKLNLIILNSKFCSLNITLRLWNSFGEHLILDIPNSHWNKAIEIKHFMKIRTKKIVRFLDNDCVLQVLNFLEKDNLICNCSSDCLQRSYEVDISSSVWPAQQYEMVAARSFVLPVNHSGNYFIILRYLTFWV